MAVRTSCTYSQEPLQLLFLCPRRCLPLHASKFRLSLYHLPTTKINRSISNGILGVIDSGSYQLHKLLLKSKNPSRRKIARCARGPRHA